MGATRKRGLRRLATEASALGDDCVVYDERLPFSVESCSWVSPRVLERFYANQSDVAPNNSSVVKCVLRRVDHGLRSCLPGRKMSSAVSI